MTTDPDAAQLEDGRPVRLVPLAPGLWQVLLGAAVMVLGPLFGFLVGSMLGDDNETWGMSPIFFFLFLGFIAAGLGLGLVLLGVRRLLRDRAAADV